jgi:hypothetical protein
LVNCCGQIAAEIAERIQPGLRAGLETQAPWTMGKRPRRATQDTQALLLEIMCWADHRCSKRSAKFSGCHQVISHFVLRRACYAEILKR